MIQYFRFFMISDSFCLIAEPGHTDSQGLTCGKQTPQSQNTGLGSEIHRAGVSMGSKKKSTMGRYLWRVMKSQSSEHVSKAHSFLKDRTIKLAKRNTLDPTELSFQMSF